MRRGLVVALALVLALALVWSLWRRDARAPGAASEDTGTAPAQAAPPAPLSAPSALAEAEAALSARREPATDVERREPDPAKGASPAPAPGDTLLISARLIDELGEPLPGARLAWVQSSETELYRERQGAAADPAGGVWLPIERSGLARDEIILLAARAPGRVRVMVPLEPERWRDVPQRNLGEICLPAGGTIEGRVLDHDGSPFEGAEVVVTPLREQLTEDQRLWMRVWAKRWLDWPDPIDRQDVRPYALTRRDGRYRIEGVPSGRFALVASVGPRSSEARLPARAQPIGVFPGSPLQAPDLVLERALDTDTIAGVVLDAHGGPLAGIEVQLVDYNHVVASGLTGADGRFELLAIQDRTFQIRAERRNRTGPSATRLGALPSVRAGTLDIVLRLSAVPVPGEGDADTARGD